MIGIRIGVGIVIGIGIVFWIKIVTEIESAIGIEIGIGIGILTSVEETAAGERKLTRRDHNTCRRPATPSS